MRGYNFMIKKFLFIFFSFGSICAMTEQAKLPFNELQKVGLAGLSVTEKISAYIKHAALKAKRLTGFISLTEYLLAKDLVFEEQNKNRPLASISPGWTLYNDSIEDYLKFEYQAFRDSKKTIWSIDSDQWKVIKPIYDKIWKPVNVRMLQYGYDSIILYHPMGRINALLFAKNSSLRSQPISIAANKNDLEWDNQGKIWRVKENCNAMQHAKEKIAKSISIRSHNRGHWALTAILLNYDDESIKELYLRNKAIMVFEPSSIKKVDNPRKYLNSEQQKDALASFENEKQLAQEWIATQWKWIEYIDKPGLSLIHNYKDCIDKKYSPKDHSIFLRTSTLKLNEYLKNK